MDIAKLIASYPTMTIRNRRSVQTTLYYANGDSITFQPSVSMTIPSAGLHQVPDHTLFELVTPSIFDLVNEGIVSLNETATGEAAPDTPAADTVAAVTRKRAR